MRHVGKLYGIPIANDDEFYQDFFERFEKAHPRFGIIKKFVKKIIVEHIDEMEQQDVVMLYLDDKIYISPTVKNIDILEEGLIHEIGHIILSRSELAEDDAIKQEFFTKRKLVLAELQQEIHVPQRIADLIKNLEVFSKELDTFFNKSVGYEKLGAYIKGYFLDAYAMSSYDEYLATGFEMFYSEYNDALRKTNPVLYRSISSLVEKF